MRVFTVREIISNLASLIIPAADVFIRKLNQAIVLKFSQFNMKSLECMSFITVACCRYVS